MKNELPKSQNASSSAWGEMSSPDHKSQALSPSIFGRKEFTKSQIASPVPFKFLEEMSSPSRKSQALSPSSLLKNELPKSQIASPVPLNFLEEMSFPNHKSASPVPRQFCEEWASKITNRKQCPHQALPKH